MKPKARKLKRSNLQCKIHSGSCKCQCEFCRPELLYSERKTMNCKEAFSNYVMLKMAGELND